MADQLHQALLWHSIQGEELQCDLCNFNCVISEGRTGHCRVRKNLGGQLYSLVYDAVCSAGVDPIEKKPLFHFQPGTKSFSIATMGCNFQCDFCQNWQISQSPRKNVINGDPASPELIVQSARESGCSSIAYTYSEPTIFMELAADCGHIAKKQGLANVFVSNGYMTKKAIDFAAHFLDAINIDLKAFTDDFYRDHCKSRLAPVLENLIYIANKTNIWLEVTTLIIPGCNDSEKELADIANFIANDLGPHVPWHISRFYPQYEYNSVMATPTETLKTAYEIAKQAGLRYTYLGNVPGSGMENTFCHNCGKLLIERNGCQVTQNNLTDGKCQSCQTEMAGARLDSPAK